MSMERAIADIASERERQVSGEGWTPGHDDTHKRGEMALAAALYATPTPLFQVHTSNHSVQWSDPWPWWHMAYAGREQGDDPPTRKVLDGDGRERHGRRKSLVIAAALIVAEIERLDRTVLRGTP